jgi:hypothetical protein
VEDGETLLYHDFLNVMLGRQRRKVYIWSLGVSMFLRMLLRKCGSYREQQVRCMG